MQDRRMRAGRAMARERLAGKGLADTGMTALVVAVLVVVSGMAPRPALAQTAPAPAAPAQTAPSPAAPTPAAAAEPAASGTPATVVDDDQIGSVLGKKVKSPAGEDMGRIVDVLVDRTGAIRAAVVDFGGFFGVGTRKIAVDWHALHFGAGVKSDAATADLPAERLRVSPVYKEGESVVILGPSPAAPGPVAPTPPSPAAPPAPPAPAAPAQK